MSIISYAQNFEDVMLWRALGHLANGFYIDVGAQHPVLDSVSNAFYEHGWRGVHIEPTLSYATLIRAARPDELVLEIALSDQPGNLTLYEIADSGLSTGDLSIAEHHRLGGYTVVETTVPCITLAELFEQVGQREIHWLKIDVEGMERRVLAGWGESTARPWVVVVESTYPNSQIETHHEWDELILERGYMHVYFDGLNRYYVSDKTPEIARSFTTPPNIFDNFVLAHSSSYSAISRQLLHQSEQQNQYLIAEAHKEIQNLRDELAKTVAKKFDAIIEP